MRELCGARQMATGMGDAVGGHLRNRIADVRLPVAHSNVGGQAQLLEMSAACCMVISVRGERPISE